MSTPPTDPRSSQAVERVRRGLQMAPRGVAVGALLLLVGLAWGVWYLAHRQFLASWSLQSVGGMVNWDLGDGHWRHGGVSEVKLGDGWNPAQVTDRDLDAIARLAHVRSLSLRGCWRLTGQRLHKLWEIVPELQQLEISNRPHYSGEDTNWMITDDALLGVEKLGNLEELSLLRLSLTDASIRRFAALRKLRRLDLTETPVTDESLSIIAANFPALESLGLEGTQVTAEGVERLMALRPGVLIDHPAALPPETREP